MYHINFVPPISHEVRRITKQYMEILDELSPVTSPLIVYVVPLNFVDDEKRFRSVGLFYWWLKPSEIHITGVHPKWLDPDAEHEWIEDYKDTLVHEFVHYERLRDGKSPHSHRGLQKRVDSLLVQIEEVL